MPAPDRLRRQFHVRRPNRAWVADLTYLQTGEGWLYLAVILALYSRRVVGWALRPSLDAVESFFSTRKQERAPSRWPTRAAAVQDVTSYIDGFYNPVRLHSTLGYEAPARFEAARVS